MLDPADISSSRCPREQIRCPTCLSLPEGRFRQWIEYESDGLVQAPGRDCRGFRRLPGGPTSRFIYRLQPGRASRCSAIFSRSGPLPNSHQLPTNKIYDPGALQAFNWPFRARFRFLSLCLPAADVLLILRPLGGLGYIPAYLVWIGATLGAYIVAVAGGDWRSPRLWLAIVAPTTLVSIISGQNGLLTAALVIGGFRLIRRWPFWARGSYRLPGIQPGISFLSRSSCWPDGVGGPWPATVLRWLDSPHSARSPSARPCGWIGCGRRRPYCVWPKMTANSCFS